MQKAVKEIAAPTVAYLVGIILVVWFLVLQSTTIPLDWIGLRGQVDLSFLGLPLLTLLVLRFASLLVDNMLVGDIMEPLSEGLETLSIAGALYFIADWSAIPVWGKPIAAFLLYASILSTIQKIVSVGVRDINHLFEPIAMSIYILLVGYLGSQTWVSLYPALESTIQGNPYLSVLQPILRAGLAEPVNNIIIIASALTSVMALTGLGANNPNSYLRYLSQTVGERLSTVALINFAALYYLLFIRHYLFELSGINPQFLMVGEWALICAAFYLGYRNLKDYAEKSLVRHDITGTWSKHMQQVETSTDPKLEHLSKLVEQFVDYGQRDELITHLTLLLYESDMPTTQITQIISLVTNYRDTKPPRIGFPWQIENNRKFNQQKRKQVINTVLASIRLD
ncbi:MAG: hypothetical protein NWF07_05945 [Candidatus Bathyarchaeota archaeon]|nr:hypothetical protein [Candidatus Bathyarchaeota archaeon]